MSASENQIVVYQPNGVKKIDVRFDGETVWLLQPQIADLFSCSLENVRLHLKNIYACGELGKAATSKESLEVRKEGNREVKRKFLYYNLDACRVYRKTGKATLPFIDTIANHSPRLRASA